MKEHVARCTATKVEQVQNDQLEAQDDKSEVRLPVKSLNDQSGEQNRA